MSRYAYDKNTKQSSLIAGVGTGQGGILPHLIIISEAGSDVTVTKDSITIVALETSTGHFECDVHEYGTYQIDAVLGGDDARVSLVVDDVKVYTVDDSHFHADITVTYPTGAQVSCSKSGETTMYATGSPYTFTVHSAGTWTITCEVDGKTYTQAINVTTTGQTFSYMFPVGSTVTPTDDVTILLHCAGIGGSSITTLADLFEDSTALLAVTSSNNAVDYLVRSTTFAKFSGLTPTMTSDTTPSGIVTASSAATGHSAFYAFDKANSYWESQGTSVNQWLAYEFTESVTVRKVMVKSYGSSYGPKNTKVQAYVDGVWYDACANFVVPNDNAEHYYNMTTMYTSNKWRFYFTDGYNVNQIDLTEVDFYDIVEGFCDNSTAMTDIGANNYCANTLLEDSTWFDAICNSTYFESVLNVKVPTMTSNTTPSGQASSSDSSASAYAVFDNDTSTMWQKLSGSSSVNIYQHWLRYQFTDPKVIKMVKMSFYYIGQTRNAVIFKVQGSNDGSDFVDIYTDSSYQMPSVSRAFDTKKFMNSTPYEYCQVWFNGSTQSWVGGNGSNSGTQMCEVQFYGREDV